MTDHDYQFEQDLREQLRMKGAKDVAIILADFYEQHGQPSRAQLWRCATHVHARRFTIDLFIKDSAGQRKVVMWLASHHTSQANVARLFRTSPSWTGRVLHELERKICTAANQERHYPTMAATQRLQAARALPRRFERGLFELGEVPPESWPNKQGRDANA